MDSTSVPALGKRLGKYEVIDRLATGGMAEVFLARAGGIDGFEKQVVCKCILPSHAADDDFVQMFLDEARLAATLHHPNVAQVFDIGRDGPLRFFAMEYIHGADLREILHAARSEAGLPLEQALTIMLGVAAGLHYAHEKKDDSGRPLGIVHRDVSPSNVLVSFDGAVKIVDFGIAKTAIQWARTRTGRVKGKVACMSPEQCRGETVDRRSDVFAIGVLLYELTTGVRPFQAETEYAIIRRIVEEDVAPPSTHRPDYPPALEAIVLRALRRSPDERYATAQELQIDLETFAREAGLVISAVDLSRYMDDLFAGKRPRHTVSAAERIFERHVNGSSITSAVRPAEVVAAPTADVRPRRHRTLVLAVSAAALLATLGGTAYWRAVRRGASDSASVAAPAPGNVAPPVPRTLVVDERPAPRQPVTVDEPASQGRAVPAAPAAATPSRKSAGVARATTKRARAKVIATSPRKRAAAVPDLDAPFPR